MKAYWRRGLPYAAIVFDLLVLWATITDNDVVTLENLRFQLLQLTGHLIDARLYDWVFDFLQSLPEKYSDFYTEDLTHQLTEKFDPFYWYSTVTDHGMHALAQLNYGDLQMGMNAYQDEMGSYSLALHKYTQIIDLKTITTSIIV